jgi:hypothetical protein
VKNILEIQKQLEKRQLEANGARLLPRTPVNFFKLFCELRKRASSDFKFYICTAVSIPVEVKFSLIILVPLFIGKNKFIVVLIF